jgi:hypothetical protein
MMTVTMQRQHQHSYRNHNDGQKIPVPCSVSPALTSVEGISVHILAASSTTIKSIEKNKSLRRVSNDMRAINTTPYCNDSARDNNEYTHTTTVNTRQHHCNTTTIPTARTVVQRVGRGLEAGGRGDGILGTPEGAQVH